MIEDVKSPARRWLPAPSPCLPNSGPPAQPIDRTPFWLAAWAAGPPMS